MQVFLGGYQGRGIWQDKRNNRTANSLIRFVIFAIEMIRETVLAAYEEMAEKYNELIDHKPHNAYYDRPNTLQLFPEVNGKVILDAACGPGKYAEILLAKGAVVKGFDLSPKMVQLAKKRNGSQGEFFVHDLTQPFGMIETASCDIVLCALAMHYIEDWSNTIKEFHRVLRPNGMVIISVEHPFFEYNYFKSRRYFEVEHVKAIWGGFGKKIEMNSFRRSLEECVMPFIKGGFYINNLIEPKPVKEFEKLDPKHYKELNEFPAFMCMSAIKVDS